jgi:predicted transcriptional regulator
VNAFRIVTWRNYTHYWIRTAIPDGTQWNGKLKSNMGDWRGRHGYGLAAPSVVRMGSQSGRYRLPADNPTVVPYVAWKDLLPILQLSTNVEIDPSAVTLPVPTVRRTIPRWINEVMHSMNEPGPITVGHRHWPSRSEAVMSCVMSGMLNGYTFREVMKWFDGYKSDRWWERTAAKSVAYMVHEAERPILAEMYNSAYDLDFKDESVLRSMIAILWYVGSTEGGISNRDLQMLSARGRTSVSGSVSRLMKNGFIELVEKSNGTKASKYKLNTEVERQERTTSVADGVHQETFRHGGISQGAVSVLDALTETSTVREISEQTGLSASGVYSALRKLRGLGLVHKTGRKYSRTRITSGHLEASVDAHDAYTKRKIRVADERRRYHRN